MGRPRKFTGKKLREETERYFRSISRTVTAQERYNTGKTDKYGHIVYDERPIHNDIGEEIRYVEYIIPPTVSGLCDFLGIHRSTWTEYCDVLEHPEFSDTTSRVRGRIRAWLEGQLLSRKDVKGIIFDLQNNHGYSEKQEIELGARAAGSLKAVGLSMTEKEGLLRELMGEFAAAEVEADETGED